MKEFIEKLICTLEEQKTEYRNIRKNTYCRRTEMDDCDSCRADHYLDARLEGINKAIKIVNELAEEYKGGCCEWEYISSVSHYANIGCKNVERNIKSMRYYTYCPYCGKKIKVIGVEGE